jgi:hypothetical protein
MCCDHLRCHQLFHIRHVASEMESPMMRTFGSELPGGVLLSAVGMGMTVASTVARTQNDDNAFIMGQGRLCMLKARRFSFCISSRCRRELRLILRSLPRWGKFAFRLRGCILLMAGCWSGFGWCDAAFAFSRRALWISPHIPTGWWHPPNGGLIRRGRQQFSCLHRVPSVS